MKTNLQKAAPDLLAALEHMLHWAEDLAEHVDLRDFGGDDGQGHFEGPIRFGESVANAQATIAKAKTT